MILRPFIDRCISVGALSEPKGGAYTVEWPPLFALDEKEQAEVAKIKTEALAAYTNAIGAQSVIPPEHFLRIFLSMSEDEIDTIKKELGEFTIDDTVPGEEDGTNVDDVNIE